MFTNLAIVNGGPTLYEACFELTTAKNTSHLDWIPMADEAFLADHPLATAALLSPLEKLKL